jgi:hypothetical protein
MYKIVVSSEGIVFEFFTKIEHAAIHLAKTYLAGEFANEPKVKILKDSKEEGLSEVKF